MIRLSAALLALAVGLALSGIGCGGGGGTDSSATGASSAQTGSSPRQGEKVTISDYEYHPAEITVPVGSAVEFTNRDSTPHTVTSRESGAFESGSIDTGETAQIKLGEPGTYTYYCVFHPFMKGTIRVE